MINQEYQKMELASFLSQKSSYFDTVAEFAESLDQMDLTEQIEWIENGSYGAGACFALQRELNGLTNRMNKTALIGHVVLRAFYGGPFRGWNKLPVETQNRLNKAVNTWLKQDHEFAMKWEG